MDKKLFFLLTALALPLLSLALASEEGCQGALYPVVSKPPEPKVNLTVEPFNASITPFDYKSEVDPGGGHRSSPTR